MLLSLPPHLKSWRENNKFSVPWIRVSKTTTSTQNLSLFLSRCCSQGHPSPLPTPPPPFCVPVPPLRPCCWLASKMRGDLPPTCWGCPSGCKRYPLEEQAHDFGCSDSPDTPQVTLLGGHTFMRSLALTLPATELLFFFFSFSDSAILHIITITNDLHWVVQSHYCRYIWYLPLPICLSWGFIQWDMIEPYSNLFPFK